MSDGRDVLLGFGGNDVLKGYGGDDFFYAGAGNNEYHGGLGTDTIYFNADRGEFDVSLANNFSYHANPQGINPYFDEVYEIENVLGNDFNNTIEGSSASNYLEGFGGDDYFHGLEANDIILGGEGVDRARYSGTIEQYSISYDASSGNLIINDLTPGRDGSDTLNSVEELVFSSPVDKVYPLLTGSGVINGSANQDLIIGAGGNDQIDAGAGDDVIHAGAGDDSITGGEGSDILLGGSGNDLFIADTTYSNDIDGGSGSDTIDYSSALGGITVYLEEFVNINKGLITREAPNVLFVSDTVLNVENVIGSDFDDEFYGDEQINHFQGGNGDDIFYASDGPDILDGGAGIDTANYSQFTSQLYIENFNGGIVVDLPNEAVSIGLSVSERLLGIENVTGTSFNDIMIGNGSDNILASYGGVNEFIGNGGNDVIRGSGNNNLASYSGALTEYQFELSGTDLVITDLEDDRDGEDTLTGISRLEFLYSSNPGEIYNLILGNDGSNTNMQGTTGNDLFLPFGGDDILYAGSGNDYILAGSGNNEYHGGLGTDTIYFNADRGEFNVSLANNFSFHANPQGINPYFDAVYEIENVLGNDFNNTIVGSSASNYLEGFGGDDYFHGLEANDIILGGEGVDRARYSGAIEQYSFSYDASSGNLIINDLTPGRDGSDTLNSVEELVFSSPTDSVYSLFIGADGVDIFYGSANQELVLTFDGNDQIDAGAGDDVIHAGAGDDRIIGGEGSDILRGEGGNDLFIADNTSNNDIDGGAGSDTIDYSNALDSISVHLEGLYPGTGQGAVLRSIPNDITYLGDNILNIENVIGGDFDDTFYGDEQINHFQGGNGDDIFYASDGPDILEGGAGIDTANYSQFTSQLYIENINGGIIVDLPNEAVSIGLSVSDRLLGIENVTGTSFNDTIIGNEVDNMLTGGLGIDTFIFNNDGGQDVIQDFNSNIDLIDLSLINDINSISELIGHLSIDTGGNIVISYGVDDSITLSGVSDLNFDNDFIF